MNHLKIWRDNYCSITINDICNNSGITDKNIKKFIKDSDYFAYSTVSNRDTIHRYLTKKTIEDIGKLFADAYTSKNYDEIDKYIKDNINEDLDMKVINIKAVMRRIMIETIQDHLLLNKYVIHKELIDHFKKVFPYCIKKYTLQYINDFFIPS